MVRSAVSSDFLIYADQPAYKGTHVDDPGTHMRRSKQRQQFLDYRDNAPVIYLQGLEGILKHAIIVEDGGIVH